MEYDTNTMARAKMTNVVVSPKDSREVSAALRGKSVAQGLALLADVKEKKRAIRFTRYNQESAGHRRGTGPGRYPLKAAIAFEDLLSSVRANAEFKDLDVELLRIVHIKADIAARPFRYGRHRGRQGKRANIEVIVQEDERLKAKKTPKAKKAQATDAEPAAGTSEAVAKAPQKTPQKKTAPKAKSSPAADVPPGKPDVQEKAPAPAEKPEPATEKPESEKPATEETPTGEKQ